MTTTWIVRLTRYLLLLFPMYGQAHNSYSSQSLAQKDYSNVVLRVLTHEKPVMGQPTYLHAKTFQSLTGAKVEITYTTFHKLYPELIWGLRNDDYDVVFFGSNWLTDLSHYLAPLPTEMRNSKQYEDILDHYKAIAYSGGQPYLVTIDGDRHYFQYRDDLLQNPSWQTAYRAQFGKSLARPKTWQELKQQVQFFQSTPEVRSENIYPLVEITKKDDLLFSQFIKRAAPYAKHLDVTGGFYFDLETMTPLINTPGFVAALEDFAASYQQLPNGAKNLGISGVIQAFGQGKALYSDSWDDAFIKAMEPGSPIKNKVKAAPSLGSTRVWNRREQEWSYYPQGNFSPYIAWGWSSGVAKNSPVKKAAFDFLGYFSNPENHNQDLQLGEFGINPFRKQDLNVHFWTQKAGWDTSTANSYIATLNNYQNSLNRVYDLNIHRGRLYMKSLSSGVYRALSGRSSAQKSLDEVAYSWARLNANIGVEKQRRAYTRIVELEDR